MSDQAKKPRAPTCIAAQICASGSAASIQMSLMSDDNVPYFLAQDPINKAVVTLDQIFVPVASRSGIAGTEESHHLPFLGGTHYSGGITYWGIGAGIRSALDTSVLEVAKNAGGLAIGMAPNVTRSGGVLSTEQLLSLTPESGEIRKSIGLRLPLIGVGAGLTVSGGAVGNGNKSEAGEDVGRLKCGPVDLRWDERKKSWVGSDFFSSDIIIGFLASDITAPSGRFDHTAFTIEQQHYTSSGTWDIVGSVNCFNKDPNFSLAWNPLMNVLVKAIRIQSPTSTTGIVLPFYIGCE